MAQIEFRAMNCQMLAVVDAPDGDALLVQVPQWFEQWEQSFSRFRPISELSQLNRQSGRWVHVSPELFALIEAARWASAFSEGLVSPLILNALEQSGYDRSFEQIDSNIGQNKGQAQNQTLLTDWRTVKVDAIHHKICLPSGARLDFGGIAKGWCAEQAAQRLSQLGPALVDAGGDMAMAGQRSEPWPIAIASPLVPDEELDLLLIDEGGVATSGRDYRRWRHNGVWQHHILDPRSGQPAQTDVLSATVVAPKMLSAECAAKVVMILGSRAGMQWIEMQLDLAALVVLENGEILRSQRMNEYLWQEATPP
ncbi:MAG: FAD:protein FMN transferase [Caldilineaceae bacterium]